MDWLLDFISYSVGIKEFLFVLLPVSIMVIGFSIATYKAHKKHKARMKKLEQEYLRL